MRTSPIALLDTLAHPLPPALFDAGSLARIRKAAETLAPVPALGFECRLGGVSSQVDVQQPISAKRNGPAILAAHAEAMQTKASPGAQMIWQQIHAFAQQWNAPSSTLHEAVTELWLETDLDCDDPTPAPSVFFTLADPALHSDSFRVALDAVETMLVTPLPSALRARLEQCHEALPAYAFVGYVGLMLTRPEAGVRLIFKNLPPVSMPAFLARIGWPGDLDDIAAVLKPIAENVPEIRLCVDIMPGGVGPSIGLETYFPKQPALQPEWHTYLDELTAQGLCTPSKRDALLAWPAKYDPLSIPDWPEHLIFASLLQPSDCFGQIRCILSHIKLTYHPDIPLHAKAYLGFLHEWYVAAPALQETS